MNTSNCENVLKAAAEGDDKDLLYTVIQQDAFVLDNIDSKPFVETPLHVAAYAGNLRFAIEVMRLKPSYAYKLNQQGFSPIHLAMQRVKEELIIQQGGDPDQLAMQMRMVLRLVAIDKDLVRVKGKEGITPLHFASEIGEVDLLANFPFACPDSIEDVNARGQTALHVAAQNNQYMALQSLVGWLKTCRLKSATESESKILNWKDEEGNTALHISVLSNNIQALQLLVKAKINLNAKNLGNFTALSRIEMKDILLKAGAKPSSKVKDFPTLAQRLNVTFLDKIFIYIIPIRRDLSDQQRDAFLIVFSLLITSTYESSVSPPGGFSQDNPGDNNLNKNAIVSQENVGKSVMTENDFFQVFGMNLMVLISSIMIIHILIPSGGGVITRLLTAALYYFCLCYIYNIRVISPTDNTLNFSTIMLSLVFFGFLVSLTFYKGLRRLGGEAKKW